MTPNNNQAITKKDVDPQAADDAEHFADRANRKDFIECGTRNHGAAARMRQLDAQFQARR